MFRGSPKGRICAGAQAEEIAREDGGDFVRTGIWHRFAGDARGRSESGAERFAVRRSAGDRRYGGGGDSVDSKAGWDCAWRGVCGGAEFSARAIEVAGVGRVFADAVRQIEVRR